MKGGEKAKKKKQIGNIKILWGRKGGTAQRERINGSFDCL